MKYRDPETGEFKEIYFKAADTLPIGSVIAFGGTEVPTNWLICDGREVSRETYKDLFSKIGTHYGEGDEETTFNLPNLAGKVAVGYDKDDEDFNVLGETGGEKEHTLTIEEMPEHNHNLNGYYGGGNGFNVASTTNGDGGVGSVVTSAIVSTGGSQPHNILQPYVVVHYIIKAFQSAGVVAEVVNTESDSTKNTYSCAYVNKKINELDNRDVYSTEETVIGTWLGKPLYRKVIDVGALPDDTTKLVAHNITNIDYIVRFYGTAMGSNNHTLPLPHVNPKTPNYGILLQVSRTNVEIETGHARSDYSGYVTIEYTKTTD